MWKYKKGDVVRVRDDIVIGENYDGYRFIDEMKPLIGKCVEIFFVSTVGAYRVKGERGISRCWWTDGMFEDVAEESLEAEDLGVLYNGFLKRTVNGCEV